MHLECKLDGLLKLMSAERAVSIGAPKKRARSFSAAPLSAAQTAVVCACAAAPTVIIQLWKLISGR